MPQYPMADPLQQNTPTARMASSGRCIAISARKLAATFWELQEISLSSLALPGHVAKEVPDRYIADTPSGRRTPKILPFAPSPASTRMSVRALRKSSVKCRFGDNMKSKPAIPGNQPTPATHVQFLRSLGNARPTMDSHQDDDDTHEIEVDDVTTTAKPSSTKERPIPGGTPASTTSSDLLKVLNRVWSLEEQHSSSKSVVTSLKSDLDGARSQVKDLTVKQMSHHREMENLTKQLADEKLEWQEKEEERTRDALQAIEEELEDQRKSKRKLSLLHKKTMKDLVDVKTTLMKAMQDLEREQKARELMEDVCDELAREVGKDKAKVEELKKESIKVLEEVEEERKMLQVAEVWREERLQMKLAEARLEIEEKNTALDKLRIELEAFLKAKRGSDDSIVKGINNKSTDRSLGSSRRTSDMNEAQSSTSSVSAIDEVRDDQRIPCDSSIDGEVKCTILNHPGWENDALEEDYVPNFEDDENDDIDGDDNVEMNTLDKDDDHDYWNIEDGGDDDDDDDLHSIELNKVSYASRFDVGTRWGRFKAFQEEKESEARHLVDQIDSSVVVKQGARQRSASTTINKTEARGTTPEHKDKVKTWNFELDSSLWQTRAKIEEEDRTTSQEEIQSAANTTAAVVKSSEGRHKSSFAQNEIKGSNFSQGTENKKPFGDTSSYGGGSTAPNSITSSSFTSLEANTSTAGWSMQNMGSSRELKGAQTCESPTRTSEPILSTPDVENSSSKPMNANVPAVKPSKEKTGWKTKVSEGKSDGNKQGRFRLCKGVVRKGL